MTAARDLAAAPGLSQIADVLAAGGERLAGLLERAEARLAEVAAASGCLACHKIGENGNAGPGPNLTKIGARLPRPAIARTLINPTAPMPSFSGLRQTSPQRFNELVNFLGSLR